MPKQILLALSLSSVSSLSLTALSGCGEVAVTGELRGPVGEAVTMQNNGGDDLEVSVPPVSGQPDPYNVEAFSFATPLVEGEAYSVTVESPPAGQVCEVYGQASGQAAANVTVLVGCEWTDDHVSRNTDGSVLGTFFDSTAPVVGGDAEFGEGRFVAFTSSALIGGASGDHRQVFWRDRLTGETVLVSASGPVTALVEGNGDSVDAAISADGLVVAFESDATNLIDGDGNSARDVFVWSANDRDGGVQRVSVSSTGAEGNSTSDQASLSADGSVVAFSSGASTLSDGVDGINTINVYRRDLVAGTTTLISVDGAGTGVGGEHPVLSDDGDRLAFYSFAADIVAGDGNDLWDIFVWQHSTQTHSRVSLTSGGGERNQGNESASRVVAPAISGDGRFVAFATTASNMVAGDDNGLQDVFVVDIDSGDVVRASIGAAGVDSDGDSPIGQGERVSLSRDGQLVAFSTGAQNLGVTGTVMVRDLDSGRIIAATTGTNGVGPPVMSFAGAYVVFGSGTPLDGRFASTGLFAHYTGLSPAFFWIDG